MSQIVKIKETIWARYLLRRCNSVGKLPRVFGKAVISNMGAMHIGERVRLSGTIVPVELVSMPGGELVLGNNVFINYGSSICAQQSILIGDNCLLGAYTSIIDTDFHDIYDHNKPGKSKPVRIEDDVWLANHVTVVKGVTIGKGAVVSTGSVVFNDVPPYTIYRGNPAVYVRSIEPKDSARLRAEEAVDPIAAARDERS